MSVLFWKEPQLKNPDMVCSWPGIGNIGLIAVDMLKGQARAEELGEIEPCHFFEPTQVTIQEGLLKALNFPVSKFYYQGIQAWKDLLFFIGEEQPSDGEKMYARGAKAYKMANMVVDVAQKFGCRRIFTSGACVAPVHHESRPRVVAVASNKKLLKQIKSFKNVTLMGETSDGEGEGIITGLNGLLLSVAKKRGLEGACLMGEIPDWLARVPFPYPRAARSVLEVMGELWSIHIDFDLLDHQGKEIDVVVNNLYEKLPLEIRDILDQRKSPGRPGPISKEEADWMKEHLDDFLKSLTHKKEGGGEGGQRPI